MDFHIIAYFGCCQMLDRRSHPNRLRDWKNSSFAIRWRSNGSEITLHFIIFLNNHNPQFPPTFLCKANTPWSSTLQGVAYAHIAFALVISTPFEWSSNLCTAGHLYSESLKQIIFSLPEVHDYSKFVVKTFTPAFRAGGDQSKLSVIGKENQHIECVSQ